MEPETFALFWDSQRQAVLCREGQEKEVFTREKTTECPLADGKQYTADLTIFDEFFTGIRVMQERTPGMKLTNGTREHWQKAAKTSLRLWGRYAPDVPDDQYISDIPR